MFNLKRLKKESETSQKGKKSFRRTGVFECMVTDVCSPDDYVQNEAIEIVYDVFVEDSVQTYREIFFNKIYNERTQEFYDYLENNGVSLDNLSEFIGCRERLTFKKHVVGNKSLLTIIERDFLGNSTEDTYGLADS